MSKKITIDEVLGDMNIGEKSIQAQVFTALYDAGIEKYNTVLGTCVDPNYPPSAIPEFEWVKLHYDSDHVLTGDGKKVFMRFNSISDALYQIDAQEVHDSLPAGVFQFGYASSRKGKVLVLGSPGDVLGYTGRGPGFGTKRCPPEIAENVLAAIILYGEALSRLKSHFDRDDHEAFADARPNVVYGLHPDCGYFHRQVASGNFGPSLRKIASDEAEGHALGDIPYLDTDISCREMGLKSGGGRVIEKIGRHLGVEVRLEELPYKPREGSSVSNLAKEFNLGNFAFNEI